MKVDLLKIVEKKGKKINENNKKLACMLLTSIIIFSGMGMFQNKSKAVTYLINETNLYSKGELVSFVYKENIKVGVQFVVYKKMVWNIQLIV